MQKATTTTARSDNSDMTKLNNTKAKHVVQKNMRGKTKPKIRT